MSERDAAEIGPILLALADPTRRRLLNALAEEGTASATRLAGRLPVSRQAVVKHLQVLQDAGLVTGARAGREVLYEVDPHPWTPPPAGWRTWPPPGTAAWPP